MLQHGTFLKIFDLGVLITGPSGIGKSELALNLIDRGHTLIADDSVEFSQQSDQAIIGKCPQNKLQEFLAIKGLGIFNLRKLFGENSLIPRYPLNFIIELQPNLNDPSTLAPLDGLSKSCPFFTIPITKYVIPNATQRNLVPLCEILAKNHQLKLAGYEANSDIIQIQEQLLI